jgi:DNA-binding NtrC family response regulator
MLDILLVDDEPPIRAFVEDALRDQGHRVTVAGDGAEAMARLDHRVYDLVISDVRLPKVDGLTLFSRIQNDAPSTQVILMTAYGSVNDAVNAIRQRAVDYLTKPFDLDELVKRVDQIDEEKRLRTELEQAGSREKAGGDGEGTAILGQSPPIVRVLEQIKAISETNSAVLITGESGSGKELVARAIHRLSRRAKGPYVAVNCAAFPESLIEAELFGHEKGAFTGATQRREGRFQAANGGTLFLDELAEMPLGTQAKLLRALQEKSFEPVGSDRSVQVDVRVVSATNQDLAARIAAGQFRQDLLYRLKVFNVHVPALRQRPGDLALLVQHFYRKCSGSPAGLLPISAPAWAALRQYPFPGNVRELQHAIEHAVAMARGSEIQLSHLPEEIQGKLEAGAAPGEAQLKPLADAVEEFERSYLKRALETCSGNRTRTAEMMGISRKCLWAKLRDTDSGDDD